MHWQYWSASQRKATRVICFLILNQHDGYAWVLCVSASFSFFKGVKTRLPVQKVDQLSRSSISIVCSSLAKSCFHEVAQVLVACPWMITLWFWRKGVWRWTWLATLTRKVQHVEISLYHIFWQRLDALSFVMIPKFQQQVKRQLHPRIIMNLLTPRLTRSDQQYQVAVCPLTGLSIYVWSLYIGDNQVNCFHSQFNWWHAKTLQSWMKIDAIMTDLDSAILPLLNEKGRAKWTAAADAVQFQISTAKLDIDRINEDRFLRVMCSPERHCEVG